jgi:hypothetical protein
MLPFSFILRSSCYIFFRKPFRPQYCHPQKRQQERFKTEQRCCVITVWIHFKIKRLKFTRQTSAVFISFSFLTVVFFPSKQENIIASGAQRRTRDPWKVKIIFFDGKKIKDNLVGVRWKRKCFMHLGRTYLSYESFLLKCFKSFLKMTFKFLTVWVMKAKKKTEMIEIMQIVKKAPQKLKETL